MGDSTTFKHGFSQEDGVMIAAASSFMTGPGADQRLAFIQKLRDLNNKKALGTEISMDRNTASCFRFGIMGGCGVPGRTDVEVGVLLRAAEILRIRSWIELPKLEPHKDEFDIPDDTPFDGAPE